ncbi:MAG: HAMP domain-containing protein [Chloroflexi bacterium]|nr:HAMP domain-containing protein [Chloroflexota bacterium]MBM3174899.1 HAMP domain-containing protein [Chloroflexota bacterium]MBM4449334.1 HAMP domain-containing protein [Chloroflexota bacterium]
MNNEKWGLQMPKRKIAIGLRGKILIPFLALMLISLGVISAIATRSIYEVGYRARDNTARMGESVVRTSFSALEGMARTLIQRKALFIAAEMDIYLQFHPNLDMSRLADDKELRDIAVQSVGQTGHTMVYDDTLRVVFHPDPKMVGTQLNKIAGEPSQFLSIVERGIHGDASGYYTWGEDEQKNPRRKYMHCISVPGTNLVVAAATYTDEYLAPAEDAEREIAATVAATTEYIEKQMEKAQLIFFAVGIGVILLAAVVIFLLSRAITRPLLALTRGTEVIGKGQLDYSIKVETGDELQQLSEQFNAMARALKESYSNLEQKVEERTRQERQRAEQLRTINEVSRRISSIVELDELIPYVGNMLRETFHYHNVNIFLFEPGSGKLALKALSVSGQGGVIPVSVPLEVDEEGVVGWVAKTGDVLLANDVSKEPRYRPVKELSDIRAELAVAVKIGNEILGVLDIESTELDAFGEADVFTAQTIADQLAVAIENARLYAETRQIAVMEERNRMAREIHDTLAQGFTGIILQLEAAEQSLSHGSKDVERHIAQAASLARKSLAEARRSVWNLRPQALEKVKLADALKQEVVRFAHETGIDARFAITGERRDLSPDLEAGLLRICQEALTNVRKHARATLVEVSLGFDDMLVTLTVRDDGVGFKPETIGETTRKERRFGLTSMQERARGLGGTFELQSTKRKGTLVRVVLPVGQEVQSWSL